MTVFARPPSSMRREDFVTTFGPLYEHSNWIAEAVFDAGLTSRHDSREGLYRALSATMLAAPRAQRLALIRAHPELAGKAAIGGHLTTASRQEQSSAGLEQCSEVEFKRLQMLNAAYSEKFEFPFILAVKGLDRARVLDCVEQRLQNDPASEFSEALAQINRIAWLRLDAL